MTPVAVGIHVAPIVGRDGRRHPSAVAVIADGPRVTSVTLVIEDAEILAAIPRTASIIAIDQPLDVPNEAGKRVIEEVLAWCDISTLPVARRRMTAIYGGLRGESLRTTIDAHTAPVFECLPDLVLRQIDWESTSSRDMDLAHYREAWLSLRAPVYRPNRTGRAKPSGLGPARAALTSAVDWPSDGSLLNDDWDHIDEAARIDAVACAYAAARHVGLAHGMSVVLDAATHGSLVVPCDANLADRLAIHVERLRTERSVDVTLVVHPANSHGVAASETERG